MGRAAITQFDPVALGRHENAAWVGYYRRQWRLVLGSAWGLVRNGFGLNRLQSVRGAWYVLRANQAWAPYPDNDPERARELMRRFYALAARVHGLPFDPGRAAELEVDWWRAHRALQHEPSQSRRHSGHAGHSDDVEDAELVASLTALYAYVHDAAPAAVRPAAQLRSRAMQLSDAWVARGCDPLDPALREQQNTLVASYGSLRRAVEPSSG